MVRFGNTDVFIFKRETKDIKTTLLQDKTSYHANFNGCPHSISLVESLIESVVEFDSS